MYCWLTQLHPTVREIHELVTVALTECTVHRNCQIKSHNHTLHWTCLSRRCPACSSVRQTVCFPEHFSFALTEMLPFLLCHRYWQSFWLQNTENDSPEICTTQQQTIHSHICRSAMFTSEFKHDLKLQSFLYTHCDPATLRLRSTIPKRYASKIIFQVF